MPIIFAAIAAFMAASIPGIVARALAAIGIGVLVYSGVQLSLDALKTHILGSFSSIGSDLAMLLGLMGFDVFVSLILSANAAVVAMKIIGGTLKKIGFVKGSGAA